MKCQPLCSKSRRATAYSTTPNYRKITTRIIILYSHTQHYFYRENDDFRP